MLINADCKTADVSPVANNIAVFLSLFALHRGELCSLVAVGILGLLNPFKVASKYFFA